MAPARLSLQTERVGSRLNASSARRRIRRSAEPSFPYAKSVVISWGLFVATMLLAAAFSDPKSGLIGHPVLTLSMLTGLPIAISAVFYTESRQRNRNKRPKSHHEF